MTLCDARPSRSKLLLEWDASPVNDMLADSMVALAAQAQTRYLHTVCSEFEHPSVVMLSCSPSLEYFPFPLIHGR